MHTPTKPIKASRVSPSIAVHAGTTAGIMPPVSMNPSQPKPVPHLLSHTKNFGYFFPLPQLPPPKSQEHPAISSVLSLAFPMFSHRFHRYQFALFPDHPGSIFTALSMYIVSYLSGIFYMSY